MREMYAITVPSRGLVDVRHSAAKLDHDDLREHGVERCHLYFPGDDLILRLDGRDDEGLLERLRDTRSGRTLLDSLEAHAWFSKLKMPLEVIARAGRPPSTDWRQARDQGLITGVASVAVNPRHEEQLRRDLHEVLPSLHDGPAVEFLEGHGLVVWMEVHGPQEAHDLLTGPMGTEMQRVLTEHTGYDVTEWSTPLAFDLEAVESGVLSRFNAQPERPAAQDPSGLGRGGVKGTWDPPPPFRNQRGR